MADEYADLAELRLERRIAEIAGLEIKLLEENRVQRNVVLAIDSEQLSVGINHGCRVVVDAAPHALVNRRAYDNPELLGERLYHFRDRTRNGFRGFHVFEVKVSDEEELLERLRKQQDLGAVLFGGIAAEVL